MGTWTLGADNATVRNVPEPGPGPIQARRPIPQLSRINAIRFDGKSIYHGLTLKARAPVVEQLRVQCQLHAVALEGRCLESGRRPSPRRTSRRTSETSSTRRASGRSRASTIATSSSPAACTSCRSSGSASGVADADRSAAGASTPIFIAQSGAPFTVNLGVDRANIGAGPAQRPDQLRNPNLPGGERTPERWFDTTRLRAPGAVHVRQRAPQQRARARVREHGLRAGENVEPGGPLASRIPLGDLQPAQSRELRFAEPGLRQAPTSAGSSAPRTRGRCSSACG